MITRNFRKTYGTLVSDYPAYSHDSKVWRWESNDAPCPLDACKEFGIPCDPVAQAQALQDHYDKVCSAYRSSMKDHVPSGEEEYEMRAAFGPGTEVVNVITGQTHRT